MADSRIVVNHDFIISRLKCFARFVEDQIPSDSGSILNFAFLQAESTSCGCASCCDSCWIDCCASEADVEIFQEMFDEYGYNISWCGLERLK